MLQGRPSDQARPAWGPLVPRCPLMCSSPQRDGSLCPEGLGWPRGHLTPGAETESSRDGDESRMLACTPFTSSLRCLLTPNMRHLFQLRPLRFSGGSRVSMIQPESAYSDTNSQVSAGSTGLPPSDTSLHGVPWLLELQPWSLNLGV